MSLAVKRALDTVLRGGTELTVKSGLSAPPLGPSVKVLQIW